MNPAAPGWRQALLTLILVWAGLVYLLEPSGSSMVAIWNSSETYAHGYVILPLALWLVWRRRPAVIATRMAPDVRALALVLGGALAWLAGRLVGAQVVEHYALVSLLVISVWALFGRALVSILLFPLFYLLMMVPAGDSLIEPMIHFTADFTVTVIRFLGIPVYQEGTFFILPSGEWSVVEACSGIRYFLSSLVLGWLYAYLTYRTWWKRAAFAMASIIVPIIANGFRAVIIVLLGHYSGMTMAVGVDHLIYGWVWFGIVMLAMFWIGNYWREDLADARNDRPPAPVAPPRPALKVALVLLALVAAFPFYERHLSAAPPAPSPLAAWNPPGAWQASEAPVTDWRPRWIGMDDQRVIHLRHAKGEVLVFLGWYGAQRQDAEAINVQNVLVVEKDPLWRNLIETAKEVPVGDDVLPLRQALLHSPPTGQRLLVWHWRHIAGRDDSSLFRGKLRLAWSKLTGRGDVASGVIIAAPYQEKPAEAEAVLKTFLLEARPGLNQTLDAGKAGP